MKPDEPITRKNRTAGWVSLVCAIVLLNGGNLLLDEVAKSTGFSLDLFLAPEFVVAIGCLGFAFLFYVRALAKLPLAVAYPVMVGVSMIVVAAVNHFWRETPLGMTQLLGVVALFCGVVLISTVPRSSSPR